MHDRVEQLHRYLDIDAKKMQYEEEQLRTQDPSFWDDRERAEEQMKLVKGLESGSTATKKPKRWPTSSNWPLSSTKTKW